MASSVDLSPLSPRPGERGSDPEPIAAGAARGDRTIELSVNPTILECTGVWKVFGRNADSLLRRHGAQVEPETLEANGLIVGVRDVSLEVETGEIFVVMGLSGSGKSTLVRCMTGLVFPSLGHLYIEGVDIAEIEERELIALRRHKLGMVFQNFALLPHLTVLQNVAFPLLVRGTGRADREQRAREMIALVGLEGREAHYPHELSGGQQQRVGIARSLTTDPQVWFLDEPFSALDPLIRYEMQTEFLRLQGLLNKTILFITHDFDEAIRLADRIAIMHDGRIVQIGTPEALVMSPANAYVAEFVQNIPKQKVLTAGGIMQSLDSQSDVDFERAVEKNAKIRDIAKQVVESERPVAVRDGAGTPIGLLRREDVLAVLLE